MKDGILVLCEEVCIARWVVRHYSPAHLFLPLVCVQLKDDAVALADVLAPPDAILQSAIGRENGEVRQHRWPVKWLCLFVSCAYNNSKTWSQSAIHAFHSVYNLLLHSNFTQSSNSVCGQSLPRRKAHLLMCRIVVYEPVCILGNDCPRFGLKPFIKFVYYCTYLQVIS